MSKGVTGQSGEHKGSAYFKTVVPPPEDVKTTHPSPPEAQVVVIIGASK